MDERSRNTLKVGGAALLRRSPPGAPDPLIGDRVHGEGVRPSFWDYLHEATVALGFGPQIRGRFEMMYCHTVVARMPVSARRRRRGAWFGCLVGLQRETRAARGDANDILS